MAITVANDSVTYTSPRGDVNRPADVVVAVNADGTPISGGGGAASQIQGNVAAGEADAGNPVKVGGVYAPTPPTYTAGERGDLLINANGAVAIATVTTTPVDNSSNSASVMPSLAGTFNYVGVMPFAFNGTSWDRVRGNTTGLVVIPPTGWSYAAAAGGIVNTTTAVTIKAAAGAGIRNYLQSLHIDHDTLGAATEIAIRDGAGGTVLWRGKLQTAEVEGAKVNFDPPIYSTANTLLEVVTLTAVTGGVYVNATGYTAP